MSVFTDKELGYLAGQRLGRIATVGPDRQPHVVPTWFRYNPEHDAIDVGGPPRPGNMSTMSDSAPSLPPSTRPDEPEARIVP